MRDRPGEPPIDALPSDADVVPEGKPNGWFRAAAMAVGSAGLLCAMATDALSVAGRHFGFTVLGAIEIFQVCIVVAATSAIVIATLDAGHARVRIVLERLQPNAVLGLERLADGLGAVIFLGLAGGSAWLVTDLWGGHELTEVLGLPLRWFRLVWVAGCLTCAALFATHVVERRS
jgi:TRAP-type C4-dicarboxylate transport system permease small subunit